MGLTWTDETGASPALQIDNTGQCDIGGATPTSPLSMDGTAIRKASSAVLGDALAPTTATLKTTGTVTIGASSSTTITHNLGRPAFVINGQAQVSNGVFVSSYDNNTFTITNFDSVSHTVNYTYI